MNVLIMDDSQLLLDRLSAMMLDVPGVEMAFECADAMSAIAIAGEHPIGVAVLDIRMPAVNDMESGFDVLRVFKQRWPACVVIMISIYHAPEYQQRSLELGADYYFDKAGDLGGLFDIVQAQVKAQA